MTTDQACPFLGISGDSSETPYSPSTNKTPNRTSWSPHYLTLSFMNWYFIGRTMGSIRTHPTRPERPVSVSYMRCELPAYMNRAQCRMACSAAAPRERNPKSVQPARYTTRGTTERTVKGWSNANDSFEKTKQKSPAAWLLAFR